MTCVKKRSNIKVRNTTQLEKGDIYEDLVEKIREENGLTQQDVAELADVERTTYASIEQGRRNPSVVNAMRIASVLDFEWTIFLMIKYAKRVIFA